MKQLKSLAWKEWHEARAFLWIGLGVFAGLPAIGGLEGFFQYSHQFEFSASPWVIAFGGVLAVFVAAGTTCRDFTGHLDDFWRSRPVSVTRWLLVKYFVGLAVVLAACLLPLAIEIATYGAKDPSTVEVITMFPFLWTVIYSIGFLSGCLLRRAAHAAMLGLAAMLLLYFLPNALPHLDWLSTTRIMDTHGPRVLLRAFALACGMLGLAAAGLALALVAVRRGWRIESGRKMMYGSISAAILIIFASAAFDLGTNLRVLQVIDLQAKGAIRIFSDGRHGFVVTSIKGWWYDYRPIELTPSGMEIGNAAKNDPRAWQMGLDWYNYASAPEHPEVEYHIDNSQDYPAHFTIKWTLYVDSIDSDGLKEQQLSPWQEDPDWKSEPMVYAWQDRLYLVGDRLVALDISNPRTPRVISEMPFVFSRRAISGRLSGDEVILNLPPVPDLPARERLKMAVKAEWPTASGEQFSFEGDTLCLSSYVTPLSIYRLTNMTDSTARFVKVRQIEPTTLERAFGSYGYVNLGMQNGLLYAVNGFPQAVFNPRVTVFDTRGDMPLNIVGYFAAPGAWIVCPLPDGRALVGGGSKLYLVGPPPLRDP